MSGDNGHLAPEPVDALLAQLDNLGESMSQSLLALTQRRQQLIEQHRRDLAELEHQRARLRRTLKAIGVELPAGDATAVSPAAAPKHRNRYTSRQLSPRKLLEVAEQILALDQETFSVLDVHFANGGEDYTTATSIYVAFNNLREKEFLGRAGRDPQNRRQIWRILDRHVIDQLRAQVNSKEVTHA